MALPSENRPYGFFGTIALDGFDAVVAFDVASEVVADRIDDVTGYGDEGIRSFLDSRDGRHLADAVVCQIRGNRHGMRRAIEIAVSELAGRRISRSVERDLGIPSGLPYLEGMVTHYAIMAEMEEA